MKRHTLSRKQGITGILCMSMLLLSCLHSTAATDDLLTAGKAAIEDGLYRVAEKQLSKYLQRDSRKLNDEQIETATEYLAQALYEQGRSAEILDLMKRKAVSPLVDNSPGLMFWKSLALYEEAKYEEALAGIDRVRELSKEGPYYLRGERLAAWCLLKLGKTDEAVTTFRNYMTKNEALQNVSDEILSWADALSGVRTDEAQRILNKLASMPPQYAAVQEARHRLYRLWLNTGRRGEAEAALLTLTTNTAANVDLRADVSFTLADSYAQQTNYDAAITAITGGLSMAVSPAIKQKGTLQYGHILMKMDQFTNAINVLKGFVSSWPDSSLAPATQLEVARTLGDRGEYENAIKEYQHYLETYTNNLGQAYAHQGKGLAFTHIKRYGAAAIEFTKAYDLYKDKADREICLFKSGDAYFANEQYQLAGDSYRSFTQEFPESKQIARATFQLGECLLRSGAAKEAESVFRIVARKFPSSPEAEEALLRVAEMISREAEEQQAHGDWLEGMKTLANAVTNYTHVIMVYTNGSFRAEAFFGRGRANYELNQWNKACQDFQHIVEAYPKSDVFERAYYSRGMCYYQMVQDEKAMNVWTNFLARYPESQWAPQIQFEVAKHSYNRKNYADAEKFFLLCVEKYPDDVLADDALLYAGKAAYHNKQYIRSIEILGRVAKEYPRSERLADARFQQVEAYYQLAKYSEAILSCNEIINKFPGHRLLVYAWLRKGDCQFWMGTEDPQRYEEAIDSYRAVANNTSAPYDLVMEALYKIGLCYEKQKRVDEALRQYHSEVMVRFLDDISEGSQHNKSSKHWFWEASKRAANICMARKEYRKAVKILERTIGVGLPEGKEAQDRIKKIKKDYWYEFR